jgi:hypothetical protein
VASSCADFPRVVPVDLEPNVRVTATVQEQILPFSRLSPVLITDGSGVYWHDTSGSVFAQYRGAPVGACDAVRSCACGIDDFSCTGQLWLSLPGAD